MTLRTLCAWRRRRARALAARRPLTTAPPQEKFLVDKIKVNGKAGKLGESGELALTRVLASAAS